MFYIECCYNRFLLFQIMQGGFYDFLNPVVQWVARQTVNGHNERQRLNISVKLKI